MLVLDHLQVTDYRMLEPGAIEAAGEGRTMHIRFIYVAIGTVRHLGSCLCDEVHGEQLVVSDGVNTAVEVSVDAEMVRELILKGFSRPLLVYNIIGRRGNPFPV